MRKVRVRRSSAGGSRRIGGEMTHSKDGERAFYPLHREPVAGTLSQGSDARPRSSSPAVVALPVQSCGAMA